MCQLYALPFSLPACATLDTRASLLAQGLRYGFVIDDLRTWAVRQDGDGRLHVTKAHCCKVRPTSALYPYLYPYLYPSRIDATHIGCLLCSEGAAGPVYQTGKEDC